MGKKEYNFDEPSHKNVEVGDSAVYSPFNKYYTLIPITSVEKESFCAWVPGMESESSKGLGSLGMVVSKKSEPPGSYEFEYRSKIIIKKDGRVLISKGLIKDLENLLKESKKTI